MHVLELDPLLSKIHRPAAAGCQVDGADRGLGGQVQGIRRGGATGNDGLAALLRHCLHGLFDRRRSSAKATFDGPHVDATTSPDELSALGQTRKGLVDRSTIPEMQRLFAERGEPSDICSA